MLLKNRIKKLIVVFTALVVCCSLCRIKDVQASNGAIVQASDGAIVQRLSAYKLPETADSTSVDSAYKLLKETVQTVTSAVNDVDVKDDIRNIETGDSWVSASTYQSILGEISACWDMIEAYSSKTAAQLDTQTMALVEAFNGKDGFESKVNTAYACTCVVMDGENTVDGMELADDVQCFDDYDAESTNDQSTESKASTDKGTSEESTSDSDVSDAGTSKIGTSDEDASNEATADKATADKATSDKATADKATSDKATSDKATSDKAASDAGTPAGEINQLENAEDGDFVYLIDTDGDQLYDLYRVYEVHVFIYQGTEDYPETAAVDETLEEGDWAIEWICGDDVSVERAVQIQGLLGNASVDTSYTAGVTVGSGNSVGISSSSADSSAASGSSDSDTSALTGTVYYMDGDEFAGYSGLECSSIPEANRAAAYSAMMEYFSIIPDGETTMWAIDLGNGTTAAAGFESGENARDYLSQAIEVVKTDLNSVMVYSSAPEVTQNIDKNWVTEDELQVLKEAQTNARAVLADSDDPMEMDNAIYSLYQAVASATDSMTPGNYGHADISEENDETDVIDASTKDRTHVYKTVEIVLIVIFSIVAALVIATVIYLFLLSRKGKGIHNISRKQQNTDEDSQEK